MQSKRLKLISLVVFGILLIPLIAMQFTDEVDWSIGDFIIAGILLFCLGFIVSYLSSKIESHKYRIASIVFFILLFVIIWVELAVGIFNLF